MARTVTRTELRTRIRQLSDTENDGHVTDTEINDLINRSLARVYDVLVASAPNYYLTQATVTTAVGTLAYNLASDFYKLVAVWVDLGSNRRRSIRPIDVNDRIWYQPPTAVESALVEYVPVCPTLASDGATFDGINGWEEMCTTWAAIQILAKKERDASQLGQIYQEEKSRILGLADRDRGDAGGVTRASNAQDPWALWGGNTIAYRLRGSTIELYSGAPTYPLV